VVEHGRVLTAFRWLSKGVGSMEEQPGWDIVRVMARSVLTRFRSLSKGSSSPEEGAYGPIGRTIQEKEQTGRFLELSPDSTGRAVLGECAWLPLGIENIPRSNFFLKG
jgi:hypothetical protein